MFLKRLRFSWASTEVFFFGCETARHACGLSARSLVLELCEQVATLACVVLAAVFCILRPESIVPLDGLPLEKLGLALDGELERLEEDAFACKLLKLVLVAERTAEFIGFHAAQQLSCEVAREAHLDRT